MSVDEEQAYPIHNIGDGEFTFGSMNPSTTHSGYPSPSSSPETQSSGRTQSQTSSRTQYSNHEWEAYPSYTEEYDENDEDQNFSYYQTKLLGCQEN